VNVHVAKLEAFLEVPEQGENPVLTLASSCPSLTSFRESVVDEHELSANMEGQESLEGTT